MLNKGTPVSRVHNITPMRSGSIELIVRTMGKSCLPIVNIDGHEYHTQLSRRNMRTIHEAFLRGDDIKSIVQRDGPSRNTIENLRNEGGFGGRWRVFNVGAYTYHTQFELGDVKKIHEGYEAGKSFARLSRLVGIHADSIEAMINQRALSSP